MTTTFDTEKRTFCIHAPCADVDEAVASAMRRAPAVVTFVGFERDDSRIAHVAAMLESTGHRVTVRH